MSKKKKSEEAVGSAGTPDTPQAPAGMTWADPMPWTDPMPWASAPGSGDWERFSTSRMAPAPAIPGIARRAGREVTGEDMLALARQHIGEQYILGARAPMANASPAGAGNSIAVEVME